MDKDRLEKDLRQLLNDHGLRTVAFTFVEVEKGESPLDYGSKVATGQGPKIGIYTTVFGAGNSAQQDDLAGIMNRAFRKWAQTHSVQLLVK